MKDKKKLIAGIVICIAVIAVVGIAVSGNKKKTTTTTSEATTSPNGSSEKGGPGGNPPDGEPPEGGAPGGGGEAPDSYNAVKTYTSDETISDETISSTGTDENAIHVSEGAAVTIKNSTIERTSSDSTGGDSSSFYGVGASILTTEGTAYVSNTTITSDAAGGAGLFSYSEKAKAYIANSTISTKQGTSGGIHVAGGGTLYAWDNTVTTNGQSSAAIRSDRGGGTMVVKGGSYTSNGTGSPAIYSTADITVSNAQLEATNSEAICIEGQNSIRLYDSNLTGNMPEDNQNDCTWNIILYQSMSGDSEEGNSNFEMTNGSITTKNGGTFYTTNTESTFTLKGVAINNTGDNDFFLKCTGNSNQRGWGSTGSNGADCLFTGISQNMKGNIIWDSISKLDLYMTEGSTLDGAVKDDESNAGNGGDGYCNITIDKNSIWTVTENSTLTTLNCAGKVQDAEGNTVPVKDSNGKVLSKGTSKLTITVTDSYNSKADTGNAGKTTSFSDYEIEKPSELN